MFSQSFFHGSRADLTIGDLIVVGHDSNFRRARPLSWVYFACTLDAAIWGAELAVGDDRQRIYVAEPSGTVFDDLNLTDMFPGNRTMSYRSRLSGFPCGIRTTAPAVRPVRRRRGLAVT